MADKRPSFAIRVAIASLFVICVMSASQWCLDRFVLYHAQNRVLQPSDYTVFVGPAAAGSPANTRLSDDGRYAVKVMTVGTSHAMDSMTTALLPIFVFGLIGLVVPFYAARRQPRQPA
ncbi:MAG: hypothetical protein JWM57_1307 [Phycisphaerales bacterium]|nr:hypothetical protein [Phycisphaerales bacterium]